LRVQGLTQRQVAAELGVSQPTVQRWLDPGSAARSRERSRAAKRRRRQACERCSRPLSYDRPAGVCQACRRSDARARHQRIARLYQDGQDPSEIARLLALNRNYVLTLLGRLARQGAVLPRFAYRDRASVHARERRIRALCARGSSRREIANRVGLTPGALGAAIARMDAHGAPTMS
jgi:DNA-binding CsgD family transcriptional regulator